MRIDVHHYIHFDGDITDRLTRIEAQGARLMTLGQDLTAQVDRLQAQNDILIASATGLGEDLQSLADQIAALQSGGGLSEADAQTLLATLTTATDRTAQAAADLAALDAQNPAPGA